MQSYYDQIEGINQIGAVLEFARDVCVEQGVKRMTYHVAPLYDEPMAPTTRVYAEGFADGWVELYDQEDFRSKNPIPWRVLKHGAMMTWADAIEAGENSAENLEYFEAMRRFGLMHGFGIPLFGPRGRDAYASFDYGRPISELCDDAVGIVRSVAQGGHQRICVLLDQSAAVPALSEREIEVLTWTARGKSMTSIAAILDLSPDTVKTYSKRVYAKLDVSDRVGAVVKALRMGVVKV